MKQDLKAKIRAEILYYKDTLDEALDYLDEEEILEVLEDNAHNFVERIHQLTENG